jgi:general secretion pathway protein B
MSFILDALKKSEIERQRQAIPGLMNSGAAPRTRGFPIWAVALVVLLGVNLAVLGFVLTRRGAPAAGSPTAGAPVAAAPTPGAVVVVGVPGGGPAGGSPAATPSAAGQSAPDSPASQEHFSPLDAAPVYAPEIPPDLSESGSSAAVPPRSDSQSARTTHRREGAAPPQSQDDSKAEDEALPTISEIDLTGQGQQALPELHLDVHVYATNPADRFVYINMHKYREGSTLQEGPMLERIRRDGVILNLHGLRFLLPRKQ